MYTALSVSYGDMGTDIAVGAQLLRAVAATRATEVLAPKARRAGLAGRRAGEGESKEGLQHVYSCPNGTCR